MDVFAVSKNESAVEQIYEEVKSMATSFRLKPDERLNEVALAKSLHVSRTPLREALNRLTMEGYLHFRPGKGFFCRPLDGKEIFDLYQLRSSVELAAAQLALKLASDDEIEALIAFLHETGGELADRTTSELVALDEQFHESLVAMSRNAEMLKVLRNVNGRIQFVRWIDMQRRGRSSTQEEHLAIALALKTRNHRRCLDMLDKHIETRMEEIMSSIRLGYGHIYTS
jgi:DNA-binding GntR family transcriptional regulator